MTPAQMQALCTHAPAYQKGCIPCSVRYIKMLRSPDMCRRLQEAHLEGLPAAAAEQVKEILRKEREGQ